MLQEGRAVDRISPKLEPPISMPLSRPSSKQQHKLDFDAGLQIGNQDVVPREMVKF